MKLMSVRLDWVRVDVIIQETKPRRKGKDEYVFVSDNVGRVSCVITEMRSVRFSISWWGAASALASNKRMSNPIPPRPHYDTGL